MALRPRITVLGINSRDLQQAEEEEVEEVETGVAEDIPPKEVNNITERDIDMRLLVFVQAYLTGVLLKCVFDFEGHRMHR